MGPTAAGKTALSLELADKFNCEIVSVDSALIYRDMNIGTAKPGLETLRQIPHHLIDIVDPTESYSVARFRQQALQLVKEINERGHVALFVGGTMLYFNALEKGLSPLPESDPNIRNSLLRELEEKGVNNLHSRLAGIDPQSAERINKNDPQRVLRALEVWTITGRTLSELQRKNEEKRESINALKICISCQDRSQLHKRIARRFEQMIHEGFVEEVASLRKKYPLLNKDMPSMRCVGYRQVWQYLDGVMGDSEMIEKGIVSTRQLAKRQLTWLRGMDNVNWFESVPSSLADISLQVESFLNQ